MPGASEEMAAMGESTIAIHFDETMQSTDMSMMGGMMVMKTIIPLTNIKDSKMTMDVMGQKYEIQDIGEEALKGGNGLNNLDNAKEVVYDKKETKEIVGFKCYKATITMNDGTTSVFYITEAIAPQKNLNKETKVQLAGYPLEMTMTTAQGEMIVKATAFSKTLPADCFKVPEGYTKVTMDEFQKQMGGM
jgi:hypothetical protein